MYVEFLIDWKGIKKGVKMDIAPGDLVKRGIVKPIPLTKMQKPSNNKMQTGAINK